MPKLEGPLFSQDARGKLGGSIIFTRGGQARKYFKPANPATAAQEAHRQAFKEYYMAALTQAQADLLYAAINHLHDGVYSLVGHEHDHGDLQGLEDDDHPQYLTEERGDSRYPLLTDEDPYPQYLMPSALGDYWQDESILWNGAPSNDFVSGETLTGWSWASTTGFDGTPASIGINSPYQSILQVYHSVASKNFFLYRSCAGLSVATIAARMGTRLNSICGVRIDDGTNSHWIELRFVPVDTSGVYSTVQIQVVTEASGSLIMPALPITFFQCVQLAFYDAANSCNVSHSVNMPSMTYLKQVTGLTWTPARYGLVFRLGNGTNSNWAGVVDWVKYS